MLWDSHVFEATSALSHSAAGLLTDSSWHMRDGVRVAFSAVDGVIVLNHLKTFKLASQEEPVRRQDPFTIGGDDQAPNICCPNTGRGDLPPFVAGIFDAHHLDALEGAVESTSKDFVMWFDASRSDA